MGHFISPSLAQLIDDPLRMNYIITTLAQVRGDPERSNLSQRPLAHATQFYSHQTCLLQSLRQEVIFISIFSKHVLCLEEGFPSINRLLLPWFCCTSGAISLPLNSSAPTLYSSCSSTHRSIIHYKVAPPAGNSCCRNFLPGNLIFAFTENLSNETEFASPSKWWHLKSANTLSLLMKNPLIHLFLSSFA